MNEHDPDKTIPFPAEATLLPEKQEPIPLEPLEEDQWLIDLEANGLKRPVLFMMEEMEELADAAVKPVTEAERGGAEKWRKMQQRMKARIILTGIATMTALGMTPGTTPKAEAGEKGRVAAGIGSELLWQADRALDDAHWRAVEEAQGAEDALRQMEWEAERLVDDYRRNAEDLAELAGDAKEAEIRNDARRLRRISADQLRLTTEQGRIRAKIERLEHAMEGARTAAGKASKEADKNAHMRDVARTIGGVLDAIRRGY